MPTLFEQNRQAVLNGGKALGVSSTNTKVSGSLFEQNRQAVLSQKPKVTAPTPTETVFKEPVKPVAPTNIFDQAKSTISNAITSIFGPGKPVSNPLPNGYKVDLVPATTKTAGRITIPGAMQPLGVGSLNQESTRLIEPAPTTGIIDTAVTSIQKSIENSFKQNPNSVKWLTTAQKFVEDTPFVGLNKNPLTKGITQGVANTFLGSSQQVQDTFNTRLVQPVSSGGKVLQTVGEVTGQVLSFLAGGEVLKGLQLGKATLPVLFATLGQTSLGPGTTTKDRLISLPIDTLTGYIFGKIPMKKGFGKEAWKSISKVSGTVGVTTFAKDVLKGKDLKQSAKEAGLAATTAGLFYIAGNAIGLFTEPRISTGKATRTPAEIRDFVNQTGIGETPQGKNLLNLATKAEIQGKNIEWDTTVTKESFLNELIKGKDINKIIETTPKLVEVPGKISEGDFIPPGEYTPAEIRGKIINSPLEVTTEGKAILRASVVAEQAGQNIKITSPEELKNLNQVQSEKNTQKVVDDTLAGKREEKRIDSEKTLKQFKLYNQAYNRDGVTVDTEVVIYRAGAKDIQPGDHVTVSKANASSYLDQRIGSSLFEKSVPIKDLVFSDGKKNEQIYAPKEVKQAEIVPKIPKKEIVTSPKPLEQTKTEEVVPSEVKKQTKELTLAPSKAKTEKQVIKEKAKVGMLHDVGNLNQGIYQRPKIGRIEISTLLKNQEFRNNPTLTVTEDNGAKLLEFKGDKFQLTLDPRGLQINGDKLKVGDKIKVDVEALKKYPAQQTRVFKNGKVEADTGGYSDVKSTQKKLENIKAIKFPELLRMYKTLTNSTPVTKVIRSYLGYHRAGRIALSYEIFKNPDIAVKTFAHELGHLTDYFPTKTMSRGNLLGRIATVRKYMKNFLPEFPGGPDNIITPKDRARLRAEAKKLVQKPIQEEYEVTIGEAIATPSEIISIWNDTMASEKMPELMEWIKRLSEQEKVEIVKGAIKGVLPEWANFSVLTKEKRIREVIKNAPADIKAKYQELVKEEIKTRRLFALEEIKRELKDLTQLWKPFDPNYDPGYTKYRYSSKELYADALSVLFNDPDLLKANAPDFFRGFFNYLDLKPEVKDAFFGIQEILNAGDDAVFQARYKELENNYKTAEETWLAQETEKKNNKVNIIGLLNTLFNDKNAPILSKVKQAIKDGKNISDDINPVYDLSGLNYLEGAVKNFVIDNFQRSVTKASEVENGWSDLGKILQLERAILERGELANPGGYDPETAQWTLDRMAEKLGADNWKVLQEAKVIFREGMQALVAEAEKEGYYNPELITQMKANPAYATFQVLDYLDQNVTSKIYQQKGTLKGVANPATSSLMKMVTTLRAMRYNKSKKLNLAFIKELGELQPAKTVWNGRSKVPVEPRDKDKVLVRVIINGKMQGFYVDKDVGDVLNHQTETTLKQLSTVTRILTQTRIYRPLFTSLNLGFQLFNFSKDFQRAWRNMPDKTVGEVFTSFPKLIANYIKASPEAWTKAMGGESAIVREMETAEIFGLNRNDIYGSPDPNEEEVTRVLRRIGVVPGIEGRNRLKTLLKPIVKLFDGIELVGNYIEALPKVAGYKQLKEKLPEKELAYYIRNYIGSPDFLTHGTATPITNNLFLFSNASKEGIKGDLNMAFTSKTKGAWWFKMVLGVIIPKMIQAAIALGLAGTVYKKMMDSVSEYDKTNYDVIMLGVDEKGQTIYIRSPKDETGRFYGALVWKFMNMLKGGDKQTFVTNLTDVFSLWAGQLPNVTPSITGASALITYLSGKNPYDAFRNRSIIPDTEFKAGFKYSFPIMLKWLANNQGASIVMPTYTPKGDMTILEKVLNLPVLANLLGRFVRVSDYGQQEIAQKIKTAEEQRAAEAKIRKDNAIDEAIKTGQPLDIVKALGHDPSSADDLTKVKNMLKQLDVQKTEGKNVYVDNLIYANTNAEKVAMLKQYKTTLTSEEFGNVLTTSVIHKIISTEVIKDALIDLPPEKQKLLNFKLVKNAYAAEGLNQDDVKTWNLDMRSGWQKFFDGVAGFAKDFFKDRVVDPEKTYTEMTKNLNDQKRKNYEGLLYLRELDPKWYYENIGNKAEKKLIGFDLGTKENFMKSKEPIPTVQPTSIPEQPSKVVKTDSAVYRNPKATPAVEPNKENVNVVQKMAEKYGVPKDLATDIAFAESSFDHKNRAFDHGFDGKHKDKNGNIIPASSAAGLFMFTNDTWDEAKRRGIIDRNANKLDPEANAEAAMWYISHGYLGKWNASKDNWGKYYTKEELEKFY